MKDGVSFYTRINTPSMTQRNARHWKLWPALRMYGKSFGKAGQHVLLEGKFFRAVSTSIPKINLVFLFRILQKSLDGSEIQTQEFPLVINTICKNFAGYLYAWDFVKENWDQITQK